MTEILKKTAELGELIKNSDIMKALDEAVKNYENDAELLSLIGEYNAIAASLKDLREDKEAYDKASSRMAEVYDRVTNHPSLIAYNEAKAEADGLMSDVYSELTFRVTGKRPAAGCTGNCSGCSGCN